MTKTVDWGKPKAPLTLKELKLREKLKKIVKYGTDEARLNVRINIEEYEVFRRICFEKRMPISKVIHGLIRRYIKACKNNNNNIDLNDIT